MGFLIKKLDRGPAPGKKPAPSKKKAEPPGEEPAPCVGVLRPICRDEAYLTVEGGRKWDREHVAKWEEEMG